MNASLPRRFFLAALASGVLATGCSGSAPSTSSDTACADGTGCGEAPEGGGSLTSGSDASASTGYDAGLPSFPDSGLYSGGDAGVVSPSDGALPGEGGFTFPGLDGGFPSLDGGTPACNPLDPKYSGEYLKAISGGLPTPCTSCTTGECCYALLACVAL